MAKLIHDKLKRYIAVREALACGFTILGISSTDRRWIHATAPDNTPGGLEVVLLREGKHCWHSFWWHHEATGSGQTPAQAINGLLGDVIGSDQELRRYERNILRAPGCYRNTCAGLYRASSDIYNSGAQWVEHEKNR